MSRKTEPELRSVSLKSIIEDTLPLLKAQLLLKNINLTKKYDDNIAEVLGDANQLQQVILNLVLNAVQAVEKQGKIKITLGAEGSGFVHFNIWDNGIGIPQEDMEKLFDPFYTTKTGKQTGIGLGLSIVQRIIKAHHGRIIIQSEVNKGTTVSVRLPTL